MSGSSIERSRMSARAAMRHVGEYEPEEMRSEFEEIPLPERRAL